MPDDTLHLLSSLRAQRYFNDDTFQLLTPRPSPSVASFGVRLPQTAACPLPSPASHSTNDKFLFLRDIGGETCLRPFLNSLIEANNANDKTHRHWGCTLVIDRQVTLTDTLILPAYFTLAGLGLRARGSLLFQGIAADQPAIVLQKKVGDGLSGHTTIRDIGIETGQQLGLGVYLEGESGYFFRAERLFLHQFMKGVVGVDAQMVTLDSCIIEGGLTIGCDLQGGCRNWRIRECNIRASPIGVSLDGGVDNVFIQGCNLEDHQDENLGAGVFLGSGGVSNVSVMQSRFEGCDQGVVYDQDSVKGLRILYNLFDSANGIIPGFLDDGQKEPVPHRATQIGLNASTNYINEWLVTREMP